MGTSALSLSSETLDRACPNRFRDQNLERKIQYLDAMACLEDHPRMYYKNDDYLTAAGHRAVADCIHHNSDLTLPGLEIAGRK